MKDNQDARLSERTAGQWWQIAGEQVETPIAPVERFGIAAFEAAGARPDDAAFLMRGLMDKSIQGDHTRGLELVAAQVRAARAGRIDLDPKLDVLRSRAATALIDCPPDGHTPIACRRAMDHAIALARGAGIGCVALRSIVGHFGPHLEQAIDAGMIGIGMTQSYPTVAPHGGQRPMLGNAPIGIGIGVEGRAPFLLDTCLTQTSSSGVKLAAAAGETVAPGLILDASGQPTTDPGAYAAPQPAGHRQQSRPTGSLLPLGGSHKAYGLLLAINLLTAILPDALAPWEADDLAFGKPTGEDERFGCILIAIDLNAFGSAGGAQQRMADMLADLLAEPTRDADGEILYPGQTSQRLKKDRRAAGTCLMPVRFLEDLTALSQELGLALDL